MDWGTVIEGVSLLSVSESVMQWVSQSVVRSVGKWRNLPLLQRECLGDTKAPCLYQHPPMNNVHPTASIQQEHNSDKELKHVPMYS